MNKLVNVTFFVLLGCFVACNVAGSRILVAAPFGTKSHKNVFIPLVNELAKRGHEITIITNIATPELPNSVEEIVIEELLIDSSQYGNFFEMAISPLKKLGLAYTMISSMFSFPPMIAEKTYSDPRVKNLLAKETFDLIMIAEVSAIVCYPMAWHFNAPVIVLGPNAVLPGMGPIFGDDDHLSYAPFVMAPYTDKMNLVQRTANFLLAKTFHLFSHEWPKPTVRSIIQRLALPNCPDIDEIERNISLYFTNSHPSFTYPRTLPPQIIEVGGMHCRPAKPLTDEKLEKFISSSDSGFIIFAVGSVIHMEDMPDGIMQSFIETFSQLPHKVIWQWKGTVHREIPKNVLAVPWLPQQDLLGDKRCKAFITHGGLNSLQEAIYHGVPVLGLPFGSDQNCNLNKATRDGYALKLDWKDVTKETLNNALRELLYNSSYKASVGKLSDLFRDQLQRPLDRAAYWSEFVLRHGGVDHLRLGSRDLSGVQRSLLDVYLLFFVIFVVIPSLLLMCCVRKCCFRRSVRASSSVPTANKKNQ